METITLTANPREVRGKKTKRLRKQGLLPLILYGHGIENKILETKRADFEKIWNKVGGAGLVDLKLDEEPRKALIVAVQKDPLTDEILHADLHQVKMTEKIKTAIPVELEGESPAVTELQGNLITNKSEIEVECLPKDLVSEIKVEISGLKTFEDRILVKDLSVPEGILVLDDPEEVVVFVEPPRSEEELAKLEETPIGEEKEAVEKIEAEAEAEAETKKEKEEGEKAEESTQERATPSKKEEKSEK